MHLEMPKKKYADTVIHVTRTGSRPMFSPGFKEFEKYLFDRKVDVSAKELSTMDDRTSVVWFFHKDFDSWDTPFDNHDVVRFSGEVFQNIQDIARRYSELQISFGLLFLISDAASDFCHAFLDNEVNCNERRYAVRSIYNVFSSLFNKECLRVPSHDLSSTLECAYNDLCFMWWDNFPCWGSPHGEIDFTVIETLEKITRLDNVACIESGLHGLGHWADAYPVEVKRIIQQRMEKIPAELKEYALKAMVGDVL